MTTTETSSPPSAVCPAGADMPSAIESPFQRAPEATRTVFVVMLIAACGPLLAGCILFGWRSLIVTALAVFGCAATERLYYAVSHLPAPPGRTHSYLTGMLLALTLPPFVPWYVPLTAAAFAVLLGKAIFGGVGHFLWQPALVGRLAVAVLFPALMVLDTASPDYAPVLAQNRLVIGDVRQAARVGAYQQWQGTAAPDGSDAILLRLSDKMLSGLAASQDPPYCALLIAPDGSSPSTTTALKHLPPLSDFLFGARPGGIGETCAVVIIIAGLYLIYRNYVKWQLPVAFIAAAAVTAAIAPINLAGPNGTTQTVWWPLLTQALDKEGLDVGFVYLAYQLLSGELLLAAFFLATEMASRPVTAGGQVLFGLGCGVLAILLRMYVEAPIPCYMAVLAMNTFTPLIESLWRPRVLGQRRLFWGPRAR